MNLEALTILSAGLLIFFISLPLVFRKVPMNPVYGIRIRAAFESDQRWYDINAYGGRQMAVWSWLITATGVAGFFVPGKDLAIYLPASTAVVLLAVLIPLVRVTQWSRRLPPVSAELASDKNIQVSDVSPTRDLLKKRTIIPALVLGLLCAGYLIFVAQSAAWLPARVATHFGASGQPNGWMSRGTYLHFITILGLSLAIGMAGLAFVLGLLRTRLSPPSGNRGLPSKRRAPNLSWLCGDMLWLACLILCFIAGTHYLTIEANRTHPAHLPSALFGILILGFGAANIGWIILLCLHLTRKPDVPSTTQTPP